MPKYTTRQRRLLIEYLEQHTDELLSAGQIAKDLAAQKISQSAVYRNLTELEKEGKLCRSSREGSREVLYRYAAAEQCKDCLHLQCRGCGKTFHLHSEQAACLVDLVQQSEGFALSRQDTVLYGRCQDCNRGQQNK